jgi:ribosome-associated protein
MVEKLRVDATCVIPLDEITWRYDAAGGPGGQHANRTRSRVEASFDVAASPSLTDAQRSRLVTRLGPVVRASSSDERSQTRNRQVALDRLRHRLADGLHQERPRRASKPTKAGREQRLAGKRHRADIKRSRSARPDSDY